MLCSSLYEVAVQGICFVSAKSHISGATLATECGKVPSVVWNSFSTSDVTEFKPSFNQLRKQISNQSSCLSQWNTDFSCLELSGFHEHIFEIQHNINSVKRRRHNMKIHTSMSVFISVQRKYWHNTPSQRSHLYFHFREAQWRTAYIKLSVVQTDTHLLDLVTKRKADSWSLRTLPALWEQTAIHTQTHTHITAVGSRLSLGDKGWFVATGLQDYFTESNTNAKTATAIVPLSKALNSNLLLPSCLKLFTSLLCLPAGELFPLRRLAALGVKLTL